MRRFFEKHESVCVHGIARFCNREHLFADEQVREKWMDLVSALSRFGCLEVLAHCHMDNHSHLLIRVPEKEAFMKEFTEEKFWKHLEILYSEESIFEWQKEVAKLREQGADEAVEAFFDRFRDRMFNLSAFWQQLKRQFTQWYNAVYDHSGTIWEGPYRCVMVEDCPEVLSVLAAYIDLNPVRAGMVEDPAEYPWSSYGAAIGGNRRAQEGLMKSQDQELGTWEAFMPHYRMLLYGEGIEVQDEEGRIKRKGFEESAVNDVREQGGKLGLAQMLRMRNRYLTHGGAIGRVDYLKKMFETHRSYFSQSREASSYTPKGGAKTWGNLRSMRDLRG